MSGELTLPGQLRDALPDAWGQHVVLRRLLGRSGRNADTGEINPMTYMINSGSDRFGAIDFQESPERYVPRNEHASLDELASAAQALEEGRPVPSAIADALFDGTSIGGARPKVTISDGDEQWIAKLSSSNDNRPVVRHEALALELARRSGIEVVESQLTRAGGRDALLVRRFDRGPAGTRIMAVSGLTMANADEMAARYITYPDLLDVLRREGDDPDSVGEELFTRIAVNIALGNSDDHARNHAALWDGEQLRLSPAYDIDPCRSPGWDSNQAMAYGRDGERISVLAELIGVAAEYGLSRISARNVVERVVETIRDNWSAAADLARLSTIESDQVLGTRILTPGALAGFPDL